MSMMREAIREPANKNKLIEGDGLVLMHNTRLDVDASVRITDLLKKIADLVNRVVYLESIVGSEGDTSTTTPVSEFRIGNWRFITTEDGNTLYKQVDLNKGLTVEPDWDTKEENTI